MELCVLHIVMGLAIEMRGYSTDTSAGTVRNSHEEYSNQVNGSGEMDHIIYEGKYPL
jgi:hypothetical protein